MKDISVRLGSHSPPRVPEGFETAAFRILAKPRDLEAFARLSTRERGRLIAEAFDARAEADPIPF